MLQSPFQPETKSHAPYWYPLCSRVPWKNIDKSADNWRQNSRTDKRCLFSAPKMARVSDTCVRNQRINLKYLNVFFG